MIRTSLAAVPCMLALTLACADSPASNDAGESSESSSGNESSDTSSESSDTSSESSDTGTDTGEPEPPPGPDWYAGDLHLHSSYSTDALDNPVAEVRDLAESLGLDYFVFTDHDNHVNGDVQTWFDPDYTSDSMIVLYGIEFTTARGHSNMFATAPWDHLQLYALRDDQGDGSAILDKAHEFGLHMSVNHPVNGDPWEFEIDLDYDSVEVWNAIWKVPASNPDALALWDELLVQGRRLTGRGGSDVHHQTGLEANLLNVGNPTTWIYADASTADAILTGLKQGRVSISYAPGAERIALSADADGDGHFEAMMGDEVSPGAAGLRLRVDIEGFREAAPYTLVIVADGVADDPITLDAASTTIDLPASPSRYVRVELHGDVPLAPEAAGALLYGDMIALSNPIYMEN